MEAAGLTLVLCYEGIISTDLFLYQIIKDNQFSELHINIYEQNFLLNFLKTMNQNYSENPLFFKGFIYLYSNFFDKVEIKQQIGYFKTIPKTKVILFSAEPIQALKKLEFVKTDPFPYCKTGFDQDYLRICLCYVPLYDIESSKVTTIDFTDFCIGYISIDDFLLDNKKRTPIFIKNDDFDQTTDKAIDFNDIHFVRPDLFVVDTLYLMSIETKKHNDIDIIKKEVDNEFEDKTYDVFKKEWNPNEITSKTYLDAIKNIICAYTFITRKKFNIDFSIRRTQIYAVLQSYSSFDDKKNHKNKGVVYQIKTGEGKSCIVSLISAILAKSRDVSHVHVVSSNIKLSKRDYLESKDFFYKLDCRPSVLLHKSELVKEDLETENENPNNPDKKFPDKYFSKDKFENSSRMNYIACGLDNNNNYKSGKHKKIIFSTLVNFECFYLHMMENCPGFINKYFDKCVLLIDEADSILLDEITNGTIISREMKSNARNVLSEVYDGYSNKKTAEEVFNKVSKMPLCNKIKLKDIEQMYKEITTVQSEEFSNGKKYSIEKVTVKNPKRIKNMLKKTVKYINEVKDDIIAMAFNKNDDDDDDDDYEEEEEILDTNKTRTFKHIIPFDYDHKGILEPNKEFSGFIPQFIALKEKEKHPELIFKDISISYLYISHPIFANLYKYICGFTGTIGKDDDKYIFSHQYKLSTQKIYRHKPNLRVDFPITICKTLDERNEKIADEILYFHKKGNPVLVIFQDFNEINNAVQYVRDALIQYQKEQNSRLNYQENRSKTVGINNKKSYNNIYMKINIFDGKDELIKPDLIAGTKGAISLGSNFCGRGTDIKCSSEYPLHVIVTFYSSNERVMQQAFGRTARKGQGGSCHIICVKYQIDLNKSQNSGSIQKIVDEIEYKDKKLKEYIEKYRSKQPWLFQSIVKQNISSIKQDSYIEKLRETRINVNRIVAYRYKFPLCLSYKTFIKIQAQKILSLFNCPNSVYTWRLVQRYIRELILESWTLMVKKVDQIYDENKSENYQKLLDDEIRELNKLLDIYIPPDKQDIVPIFINICKNVIEKYEKTILDTEHQNKMIQFKIFGSTYINIGFKPYSLLSESGARILYTNLDKMNYISDPELKYLKQLPNNKFSIISITERIDDALNFLFQTINKILGQKTFLKFFVRRTIAGCEFGACFDFFEHR